MPREAVEHVGRLDVEERLVGRDSVSEEPYGRKGLGLRAKAVERCKERTNIDELASMLLRIFYFCV